MTYYFLFTYILIVNVISFMVMRIDKKRARKGLWRISEATIFCWAFIGGAVGVYLGMKFYRHKTKVIRFKVGIPLLCITNLVFFSSITFFFMS